MLVLATLGATARERGPRALRPRRRTAAVAPEPGPAPVTTARATLIAATPFGSDAEAQAWQAALEPEEEVADALRRLNEVLRVQRAAAADPGVRAVARGHLLVARVGVGRGEQVAHGRWSAAVEVPAPARTGSRASGLRPQERLAAVLGGRDVALACEELALRAREDLDLGHGREAALQLRIALEAALSELSPWSDRHAMSLRLDELRDQRAAVGEAANRALQGGLDDESGAQVARVLALVEAALRARAQLALEHP